MFKDKKQKKTIKNQLVFKDIVENNINLEL